MTRGLLEAFWWTLRVGSFTAAALVILALSLGAFCGCGAEAQRIASLDNGRTVMDDGRVHVQPLPARIDCTCSDIRCDILAEAAGWWNEQMAAYGHEEPVVLVSALPVAIERPHLCVVERELPPGVYSAEWSHSFSRFEGENQTSILGRATAYVHPRHWWPAVLRHAIGHYMGLAEDPPTTPPPSPLGDLYDEDDDYSVWSLDLRSIMQSDAPPWGEVTPGDAYLLMHPHEDLTGLEEW